VADRGRPGVVAAAALLGRDGSRAAPGSSSPSRRTPPPSRSTRPDWRQHGHLIHRSAASAFRVCDQRPPHHPLFERRESSPSPSSSCSTRAGVSRQHRLADDRAAVQMFTRLLPPKRPPLACSGNRIWSSAVVHPTTVDELSRTTVARPSTLGAEPRYGARSIAAMRPCPRGGRRRVCCPERWLRHGPASSDPPSDGPSLKDSSPRAQIEDLTILYADRHAKPGRRPSRRRGQGRLRPGAGFGGPSRRGFVDPDRAFAELAAERGGRLILELKDRMNHRPRLCARSPTNPPSTYHWLSCTQADGAASSEIEVRASTSPLAGSGGGEVLVSCVGHWGVAWRARSSYFRRPRNK
jgi:hypothetical protein